MSDETRTDTRPADVGRPARAKQDTEDTKYGLGQWLTQVDDLGVHPWDVEAVMRTAGKDEIGRTELVALLAEHGRRPVGPDATAKEE